MSDSAHNTSSPGAPQGENNFRIDFIDPLFAVAIHIGFVEGLLYEPWLEDRRFPSNLSEFANVFLFVAALWTIIASWVGYHKSIKSKPILGDARFVLDVILLMLYIFLLLYFKNSIAFAVIMFAIYAFYVAWDFHKTKEYPSRYYDTGAPNMLKYLALCFSEWFNPEGYPRLINETVTLGWAVFFLILLPFTFLPFLRNDCGKIAFALVFVVSNQIYRHDKGSKGSWICSTPFKLFMAGAVGYLILYQTRVLCSG